MILIFAIASFRSNDPRGVTMEPNETTLVEQLALLNDVEGVSNAIDSMTAPF